MLTANYRHRLRSDRRSSAHQSSNHNEFNTNGGTMKDRHEGSESYELDRDTVTHWAAHAAGLLHFGVTFDSISLGGDECFPIESLSTDDGTVTARIALMGMCVDLFNDLLEADVELPSETIVGGSIVGWREDLLSEGNGYRTDLLNVGGRIAAEVEWAFSFVLSNLDPIEQIADAIIDAEGRIEYRTLLDGFAGQTVEPSATSEDEAANTFAGHSSELELIDEAVREILKRSHHA